MVAARENAEDLRLEQVMRTPVEVVEPSASVAEAWRRMRRAGVRHLAVVVGRTLVGVLSERDLGGPRGLAVRSGLAVGELMTPEPLVGSPKMSVAEAARQLAQRRLGCMPVVDAGGLVGIVTTTDLLELLGAQAPPAHR